MIKKTEMVYRSFCLNYNDVNVFIDEYALILYLHVTWPSGRETITSVMVATTVLKPAETVRGKGGRVDVWKKKYKFSNPVNHNLLG